MEQVFLLDEREVAHYMKENELFV